MEQRGRVEAPPGEPIPDPPPNGLPSNHPLLREAQTVLKQHLEGRLAALDQQLSETQVKARQVETEHSELGQQLYEAQRRLCIFQHQIKKLSEQEEAARKSRATSEKEMQKAADQLRAEEMELGATRDRLLKARADFNDLKYALQRAEAHANKLEDATKLKRRQLYKDNESLRKVELQKMRQDFFLDRLNGQLQEMIEQKDLLITQIKAQEADAQISRAAIQESQREIEGVVHGKRQLRLQLGTCIQGLEMRSRAEVAIKKAIQEQETKAATVQNDVRELERSMRDLQEANETLTVQRNSTRRQLNSVRTQISKAEATHLRMREQIEILSTSLIQAQQDAKKAEALAANLVRQREAVIREVQDSMQQCNALSDQIFEALASQASITRAGTANQKKTKNSLLECESREAELCKIDFERAQLQVESVGVRAAIASTEEDIAAVDQEIAEKEKLIDQYQAEIRKGHILISRKQQLVDQLNREYDAKKGTNGEESSSTLDATIRALKNQMAHNAQNITELQQSWIKKQTLLISLQADIGEKREKVIAQKDELLIRKQRNLRIIGEVEATKRDIKVLTSELKDLQHLADRMGRQLAVFREEQAKYENEAHAVEGETDLQMAERDKQKQLTFSNLEKTRRQRDDSLKELVNLERQVMLWERKITLEKEMQNAIDPSIGQSELTAMRKEIHRMELREVQLKKAQEHLVQQLNQMLAKRDVIQMRNEPGPRASNDAHQKAVLQRQIASLDMKLKEMEDQGTNTEVELESATTALSEVQELAASLRLDTEEAQNKTEATENALARDKVRMAFEQACLTQLQNSLRKLAEITDEDLKVKLKPSVELSVQKIQNEAASVAAVLRETKQGSPTLQSALEALREWALHLVKARTIYKLQPRALRVA